ncbi:glycosyltransferase family 8 protein [Limosilactobacillus ingluviei]
MPKTAIVLAANYGYLPAAETTLKSLFYHTPRVTVYLANEDIPPEWFRNINHKLAGTGSRLVDLKIDLARLATGTTTWPHINQYSYVKIHVPQLLTADRIVYLDSDLIVRHSLWPLMNFDLQDQPVGMAHEINSPSFNSGVVLIDRARWQAADLTKRCIEFFSQHEAEIDNGDQTVLNRVCEGQIQLLPATFNNQVGMEKDAFYRGWPAFEHFFVEDAVIDHYTTADKPWQFLSVGRGRAQWWQYHNLEWQMIGNHLRMVAPAPTKSRLLLYTAWAELNQLEDVIKCLPDCQFEIATPVLMNFELKRLSAYPNVNLHESILPVALQRLIETSQAMLDLTMIQRDDQVQAQFLATGKPVLALARDGYQNAAAQFFASPAALAAYVRTLVKGEV